MPSLFQREREKYIHIYMCTYTHICTSTYIGMCVYIYIYMYVQIQGVYINIYVDHELLRPKLQIVIYLQIKMIDEDIVAGSSAVPQVRGCPVRIIAIIPFGVYAGTPDS